MSPLPPSLSPSLPLSLPPSLSPSLPPPSSFPSSPPPSFSPPLTVAQGNIGVLDAGTRGYTTKMRSHTESVCSVCVDSQGKQLVTCSLDHTIRVWNTATGEQVRAKKYTFYVSEHMLL